MASLWLAAGLSARSILICPVGSHCPVICLLSHVPSQGLALNEYSILVCLKDTDE